MTLHLHFTLKISADLIGILEIKLSAERRYSGNQRRLLKRESLSFLEKTRTFEKSLLRDNNLIEFFFPSRLNDPGEQNRLSIGY